MRREIRANMMALPFLFISFGNHQFQGQPLIAELVEAVIGAYSDTICQLEYSSRHFIPNLNPNS
jgi:hypothetical protein